MMMNMMSTTADPRKGSEMGTLAPHLTYGIIPYLKILFLSALDAFQFVSLILLLIILARLLILLLLEFR